MKNVADYKINKRISGLALFFRTSNFDLWQFSSPFQKEKVLLEKLTDLQVIKFQNQTGVAGLIFQPRPQIFKNKISFEEA